MALLVFRSDRASNALLRPCSLFIPSLCIALLFTLPTERAFGQTAQQIQQQKQQEEERQRQQEEQREQQRQQQEEQRRQQQEEQRQQQAEQQRQQQAEQQRQQQAEQERQQQAEHQRQQQAEQQQAEQQHQQATEQQRRQTPVVQPNPSYNSGGSRVGAGTGRPPLKDPTSSETGAGTVLTSRPPDTSVHGSPVLATTPGGRSPIVFSPPSREPPVISTHPVELPVREHPEPIRVGENPVLAVRPIAPPRRELPPATGTVPTVARPTAAQILGSPAQPTVNVQVKTQVVQAAPPHVTAAMVLGVQSAQNPNQLVAAQQQWSVSGRMGPPGYGIPVDPPREKSTKQGGCSNWIDDTVSVTALGEDSIFINAGVLSGIVDGSGSPSFSGQYVRLQNNGDIKVPFYYGMNGTADQQLAPGRSVTLPATDPVSYGNRQQHITVRYCKG